MTWWNLHALLKRRVFHLWVRVWIRHITLVKLLKKGTSQKLKLYKIYSSQMTHNKTTRKTRHNHHLSNQRRAWTYQSTTTWISGCTSLRITLNCKNSSTFHRDQRINHLYRRWRQGDYLLCVRNDGNNFSILFYRCYYF